MAGEGKDKAIGRLSMSSPRDSYYSSAEQTAAIAAAAQHETMRATAGSRPSPFAYHRDTLEVDEFPLDVSVICVI